MTEVTIETQAATKFDAEAFAMNIARAMESGGRALAAYLKPRESGEVQDKPPSELAEVIKTMTAVADRIIRVEICSATATNPLRTISSVMGSTDMSDSCLQSRLTIAFMKWS